MTKKQAKQRSLKLWRYLARHPAIWTEEQLPDKVKRVCGDGFAMCLYHANDDGCGECPLAKAKKRCLVDKGNPYARWLNAFANARDCRAAALEIVGVVEAWDTKDF